MTAYLKSLGLFVVTGLVACSGTGFNGSSGASASKKSSNQAPASSTSPSPVPSGGVAGPTPDLAGGNGGAAVVPTNVNLSYHYVQSDAGDMNCLSLKVNDGAPVATGCNRGVASVDKSFVLNAKPFCNKISVIVNATDHDNGAVRTYSSDNPAQLVVDKSIVNLFGCSLHDNGGGVLDFKCNDNGDDEARINYEFTVGGLDSVFYQIGSFKTCP